MGKSVKRHPTGVKNVVLMVENAISLEARSDRKTTANAAISTRVLHYEPPANVFVKHNVPVHVGISARVLRYEARANVFVKHNAPIHVGTSTRVLRHKTHAEAIIKTACNLVAFDVDGWMCQRELYLDKIDAIWGATHAIPSPDVSIGDLLD